MYFSSCIDWLSFSSGELPSGVTIEFPDFVPGLDFVPDVGRHGYKSALRYECGLVIMYNAANKNMGCHYQYSGSTLNALRARGVTDMQIIKWHDGQHHKASRVDLAIDARDCPGAVKELQDAITNHGYTAKPGAVSEIKKADVPGYTINVNKRSSPRCSRIYDWKALHGGEEERVRFEAELKGKRAKQAIAELLSSGDDAVSALCRATFASMIHISCQTFVGMMQGEMSNTSLSAEEEPKTKHWLLAICAKSLARYHQAHPDEKIVEQFNGAVSAMLSEQERSETT